MLKDYDMSVHYHPGKDNVVVDALSRMTMGSVSHVVKAMKYLVKDVHRLARLGVRLEDSPNGGLRYQKRLCVPKVDDLRNQILEEDHGSRLLHSSWFDKNVP